VIVVSIVEVDGDFTSSMAKEEGVWRRKKEAGRKMRNRLGNFGDLMHFGAFSWFGFEVGKHAWWLFGCWWRLLTETG
jgi:hypothetical protein